MLGMDNCNSILESFLLDILVQPCPDNNGGLAKPTVGVGTWMTNYIQLFYVSVIVHPCIKPDVELSLFMKDVPDVSVCRH